MSSKSKIDAHNYTMQAFLLDYVPALIGHATALVVFLYCNELKDASGVVEISYNELKEHLGISTTTIREAFRVLCEKNLLQRLNEGVNGIGQYKINIVALSKIQRREIFKQSGRKINTCIRRRILDVNNWPMEYQRLIDKKCLREALKALGPKNFNLRSLIDYFGLDKEQARLFVSSSLFENEFTKLRAALLKEHDIREEVETDKVSFKKATQERSTEDLYELLMSIHLDKEGHEKAISTWKAPELLRYFCVCYERTTGQRYVFHQGGMKKSLSCREMRDIKNVLSIFKNRAESVVEYIDWAFEKKHPELPDGLGTAILRHSRMLNGFSASRKRKQTETNGKLDGSFKKWLEENASTVLDRFELADMHDLHWLKEYCEENEDEDVQRVVNEARRRRLILAAGETVLDER